jgi:hypothetical protein
LVPTDSPAPTESPSESQALTPSPEPTASPPAGSLEEYLASIAAPVVAEIDGKPEWVIARHGSITRLAPADDVTFAFYRNGLISIGQPRGENRSIVRVLDPSGQEVASFEVPALGPDGYVSVARDRRLAYVTDSRSIFRVDLELGEVETVHDGMPGFRLELSPTGNTLASVICPEVEDPQAVDDTYTCQTQVITQTSIFTVDEFNASGATDEYLIGGGWPRNVTPMGRLFDPGPDTPRDPGARHPDRLGWLRDGGRTVRHNGQQRRR